MNLKRYDFTLLAENDFWIPENYQSSYDITGVYTLNLVHAYDNIGKELPWKKVSYFQIYSMIYTYIDNNTDIPEKWFDVMVETGMEKNKLNLINDLKRIELIVYLNIENEQKKKMLGLIKSALTKAGAIKNS